MVRQSMQIVMLSIGAWLVIEQKTTPGVMIAATILLSRAFAPIESAIAGWKSLVDAHSANQRLTSMFENSADKTTSVDLPAPTGAISVEQVLFGFKTSDRFILKQISFNLAPGQPLAIVGPSASGKSTLARLLIGVWQPAIGKVRLDGVEITSWPRAALSRYIGYLPQDVELFAGSVSENIARMGKVDSQALIEAAQLAQAHEFILRLPQGYDTQVGEGGIYLSGGQRQRIALARLIFKSAFCCTRRTQF